MKYLKKFINWFKKDSNKDLIELIEKKVKEEIQKEIERLKK